MPITSKETDFFIFEFVCKHGLRRVEIHSGLEIVVFFNKISRFFNDIPHINARRARRFAGAALNASSGKVHSATYVESHLRTGVDLRRLPVGHIPLNETGLAVTAVAGLPA